MNNILPYKFNMIKKNTNKILYVFIGIVLSIMLFIVLLKTGKIQSGNAVQKYEDTEIYGVFSNREVTIDKGDVFKQELLTENGKIYSFSLKYHTEIFEKGTKFTIKLYNQQTDKEIQSWIEDGANIGEDGFDEYKISSGAPAS